MKKLYAMMVDPCERDYIFDIYGMDELYNMDKICITGNRDYYAHTTDMFDAVVDSMYEGEDYLDSDSLTLADFMADFQLKKVDGTAWSRRELSAWYAAIRSDMNEREYILFAMEMLTGEPWEHSVLRGCSQSEWQDVYFAASVSDCLDRLEADYFCTADEYAVSEFADMSGAVFAYAYSWHEDDIKRELANSYGYADAEVVIVDADSISA